LLQQFQYSHSSARSSINDCFDLGGVELERGVDGANRLIQVFAAHDHRDPDLRGGDHFDVDTCIPKRAEQLGGNARVGTHSCADQGELSDVLVVHEVGEAEFALNVGERGAGGFSVIFGKGEGHVGESGFYCRDVPHDHVDVAPVGGDDFEDARGRAGS